MKRLIVGGLAAILFVFAGAVAALFGDGMRDRLGFADLALVLGNKVETTGRPVARLQARLDAAVSLYKRGFFKVILVSGGTGAEGFPEGSVMKDYLVSRGVPTEAIIVDNAGVDTFASAQNTAKILAERHLCSVFVVTQYFHVPRSRIALQKVGVTEIFSAHAPYFEARDVYSILRELPAYVKYVMKPNAPAWRAQTEKRCASNK